MHGPRRGLSLFRAGCLALVTLMPLLCASPSWTADSSLTITPQTSHTEALLMGLYFRRAEQGWAVGSSGTILKTVDGGKKWKKIASGTTASLSAVFFFDEKQGWAVGANGTILRSQDGGNTWHQ
ncbi:MAG: hypothetical protein H7Y39_12800, partial [Nitrospiraceae bacterium]|nr:hypothetical protein [Nitrospiraceae bacterium]